MIAADTAAAAAVLEEEEEEEDVVLTVTAEAEVAVAVAAVAAIATSRSVGYCTEKKGWPSLPGQPWIGPTIQASSERDA